VHAVADGVYVAATSAASAARRARTNAPRSRQSARRSASSGAAGSRRSPSASSAPGVPGSAPPQRASAHVSPQTSRSIAANAAHLDALKSLPANACRACGLAGEALLLDLHHPCPAEKVCDVSRLVWGGASLLAVLAEAAQCVPLCVVCHRRHEAG